MGYVVRGGHNVPGHQFIHTHEEYGGNPVLLPDQPQEGVDIVCGDLKFLDAMQVTLDELGGEGVHEALDALVVVEHVEEGLGAMNSMHLTKDEVYDRLMAMCDESIALSKQRQIDKSSLGLPQFPA